MLHKNTTKIRRCTTSDSVRFILILSISQEADFSGGIYSYCMQQILSWFPRRHDCVDIFPQITFFLLAFRAA